VAEQTDFQPIPALSFGDTTSLRVAFVASMENAMLDKSFTGKIRIALMVVAGSIGLITAARSMPLTRLRCRM
jgi:hypothetical protein